MGGNYIVPIICLLVIYSANAQLSANFYDTSCPTLQTIVSSTMSSNVDTDNRVAASILRLSFHDCFVNGCDASVLLDDTSTLTGEKTAQVNQGLGGFDVIDAIKTQVEAACAATVSCADIIALAARDGVVLLGGQSWTVPLGRRDSLTASLSGANSDLPSSGDSLSTLISLFAAKGLTAEEMTVLSGSHTIGQARCVTFRNHIYNDANIDPAFAATVQADCPASAPTGDSNLSPLDTQSPNQFGNSYYENLVAQRGLLGSDQVLFNGDSQDALVTSYSTDNAAFLSDFGAAMVRMTSITPLTGTNGEIRLNCRVPN